MAQKPTPTCAAIYCRVSTDEQAEHGYSLDDQQRRGRAALQARAAALDGEVYIDDGVSGTLRRRPALDRLIRDARAGRVDVVIVTKLDRLARKLKVLLSIWDELEDAGCAVVIIEESIDTSTAVGCLIRSVLGAIAEFELENIKARTMNGRREKARRGEVWRSRVSYGHVYTPGDKDAGTVDGLDIDQDAAPIIREIFERIAAGAISATKLAEEFNARAVPTQRGGRWDHATILKIIKNPVHTGRAAYGRYHYSSYEAEGDTSGKKRHTQRKADPESVIYGNVPAIVTPALAAAAQAMLAHNRVTSTRNARVEYLLGGGLVACAVCGRTLTGMTGGRGGKARYYQCRGTAPRHTVSGKRLDAAVTDALARLLDNPEVAMVAEQERATGGPEQDGSLAADIARAERKLSEVKTQRDELLDLRLKRLVDDALYAEKDTQLAGTQKGLLAHLDDLHARCDAAAGQEVRVDGVREMCALLASRFREADITLQRHIIRLLVVGIVASSEEAEVTGVLPAADRGTMATMVGVAGEEGVYGGDITGPASPKRPRRPHPRLS